MSMDIDRLPQDFSRTSFPTQITKNSDFESKHLAPKFERAQNQNQGEGTRQPPRGGEGATMPPPPPQGQNNASGQDFQSGKPPFPPQGNEEGQWPSFNQNNTANEGGFGAPPSFGQNSPERQNGPERQSKFQNQNGSC